MDVQLQSPPRLAEVLFALPPHGFVRRWPCLSQSETLANAVTLVGVAHDCRAIKRAARPKEAGDTISRPSGGLIYRPLKMV